MARTAREKGSKKRPNQARALALHRKLVKAGLGDRFEGMTQEEIIGVLRKTRDEIWSEKLATRS